jgi:uncharacterized protein
VDVLVRYDVGVSISIDGPEQVHDRFRRDHGNCGSFERVIRGIAQLTERPDARPLFAGVLAVIDPESDPRQVYEALKATGAPCLDFLPRDGNWDRLPFAKCAPETIEYGDWLARLLTIYLSDPRPPRVRLLDDMLRLMLGGYAQKEGLGTADYGILVIEADGRVEKNDTHKVAGAGADRFERQWSVADNALDEILASVEYQAYYRQQRTVSAACIACTDLGVCGGTVAHRWSAARGYDNPTIFCADQRHLIGRMRHIVEAVRRRAA